MEGRRPPGPDAMAQAGGVAAERGLADHLAEWNQAASIDGRTPVGQTGSGGESGIGGTSGSVHGVPRWAASQVAASAPSSPGE